MLDQISIIRQLSWSNMKYQAESTTAILTGIKFILFYIMLVAIYSTHIRVQDKGNLVQMNK